MRKTVFVSFVLGILLSMLHLPSAAQTSLRIGVEKIATPSATEKARVLLQQLAMVQQFLPPEKDQINTGKSSNYIFVRPILREIYLLGKDALPALAEFFDNENYLYSFSGANMANGQVAKLSVGITVERIFHEIINPVPRGLGYESSKMPSRIGADGNEYRAPGFSTSSITETRESARQWLQQNADKSLAEIQREIVDFYIHEEIKIGFPDEESYQNHLVPLLNLRENLPYVSDRFHAVEIYSSYSSPPPPPGNQSQSGW